MDKRVAATVRRRSAARRNQDILIARTVLTTCAPCYPLAHGDICSRTAPQSIQCALSVLSVMKFFRRLPSPLFLTGGDLSRTLLPTHAPRPFAHRVTPLAQLCRSPVCFVRGQSACYAGAACLLALVYTAQQHSLSFFGTQWHAVSVSSA